MNKTKIEWLRNPDGSAGYTFNPITGCLNNCPYCYARKLANGRLRTRYLANENIARRGLDSRTVITDPFYPRFWPEKLSLHHNFRFHRAVGRQRYRDRGVFVCDMSDLFGIGIPDEWTWQVIEEIKQCPNDRFYLLTKQPQNLIKFSPFPDNCWVGVSATDQEMMYWAVEKLGYESGGISAKVKYLSLEPLLEWKSPTKWLNSPLAEFLKAGGISWVIIGAQTKPYKPPKIEWVQEIVEACDKAGIPVFLKENLRPLINSTPLKELKGIYTQGFKLRQEMPVDK